MRLLDEADDAILVARCLAGEKRAFGSLVERHRPRIARLLQQQGEPADVDDLLQEAFLQAYLGLDRLREPAHFGAWVYGIARNLLYSRWRKRTLDLISLEMLSSMATERRRPPEQVAERREDQHQLRRAIAALRPAEREAVRLVYLQGFSHREAAARLGTSVGAIKVRLHRGRRRLQTILGAEFGPIVIQPDLEVAMIPVTVHDILIKTKAGETLLEPGTFERFDIREKLEYLSSHAPNVILLKEQAGERVVCIWVGPPEAAAILFQLQGVSTERPMTFDLTKTLLELGSVVIENAAVSRLHEEIFYGTLFIRTALEQELPVEVDCRPSDAINLALRLNAPLSVAAELMAEIGRPLAEATDQAFGDDQPLETGESWFSLLRR